VFYLGMSGRHGVRDLLAAFSSCLSQAYVRSLNSFDALEHCS